MATGAETKQHHGLGLMQSVSTAGANERFGNGDVRIGNIIARIKILADPKRLDPSRKGSVPEKLPIVKRVCLCPKPDRILCLSRQ